MLQSVSVFSQAYDISDFSSKKPIVKEYETDRFNFVKNDPFLDISISNQARITQLQREIVLLKSENKRQR